MKDLLKLTEYTANKIQKKEAKEKQIKPLPVQPISNNKKQNKFKSIEFISLGIIIGVVGLSFLISYDIIDNFHTNDELQENKIISYNQGAFFIMNYTASTGVLPYINKDGELMKIKCIDNNLK